MRVVTRFAPSPTGQLHLGGARTALFAWLHARANGGRFLLRFEDTDAARSDDRYERDILAGLRWLGLNWDGQAERQSDNEAGYRELADRLIAADQAYWCDCSPERLEALRQQGRRAGQSSYDGRCRDRGLGPGAGRALRLRVTDQMRQRASEAAQDLVLGEIGGGVLDDMVLRRSDRGGAGGFGYHLCCVADDHRMQVTHVIRGADHQASVARQLLLYHCLDWQPPLWAHLPLVLSPDGSRLSKRRGARAVNSLAEEGYLAEAVVNFLARLGWSSGDREFFADLDALAAEFDLSGVSRVAATSDLTRLRSLNAEHCKHRRGGEMLQRWRSWQTDWAKDRPPGHKEAGKDGDGVESSPPALNPDADFVDALLERHCTLSELDEALHQLAVPPQNYDGKAAAEAFSADALSALRVAREALAALAETAWDRPALSQALRGVAKGLGGGFAAVGMPLRLALTGEKASAPVDALCAVLGRQQVLDRLDAVVGTVSQQN